MDLELIKKIKTLGRVKPRIVKPSVQNVSVSNRKFDGKNKFDVIAIGASTGGPTALEQVISVLPGNLTVPVVICQHMPANFIHPFVHRLNGLSALNIVVGKSSMVLKPGMIVVSPGDANMIVEKDKNTNKPVVGFSTEVYKEYNHPSINAMMLSVAETYGAKAIGAILTGMGKDGVKGLKEIKDKGGVTVAQNRESSVIYGMPKAAVESKAVTKVLDIKEIGSYMVSRI